MPYVHADWSSGPSSNKIHFMNLDITKDQPGTYHVQARHDAVQVVPSQVHESSSQAPGLAVQCRDDTIGIKAHAVLNLCL